MRGPDNAGRMRLLDRYLLRELLVPSATAPRGFLIFWITSDLISDLDVFQRFKLLPRDVAAYYLVRMPELLVTVLPVALLLALLYTLTNMARHQELTAMRAAGLSPVAALPALPRRGLHLAACSSPSTRSGCRTPTPQAGWFSAAACQSHRAISDPNGSAIWSSHRC